MRGAGVALGTLAPGATFTLLSIRCRDVTALLLAHLVTDLYRLTLR